MGALPLLWPLVVWGHCFYKRLASHMAAKRNTHYSSFLSWIHCKISFVLIHSITRLFCLCGTCTHPFPLSCDYDLALAECRVTIWLFTLCIIFVLALTFPISFTHSIPFYAFCYFIKKIKKTALVTGFTFAIICSFSSLSLSLLVLVFSFLLSYCPSNYYYYYYYHYH